MHEAKSLNIHRKREFSLCFEVLFSDPPYTFRLNIEKMSGFSRHHTKHCHCRVINKLIKQMGLVTLDAIEQNESFLCNTRFVLWDGGEYSWKPHNSKKGRPVCTKMKNFAVVLLLTFFAPALIESSDIIFKRFES